MTHRMTYYRIEEKRLSISAGWEDSYGTKLELWTYEFPVLSLTPKGVWIDVYGTKRFILSMAKKKWACPSKKDALTSFIARKKRQRAILRAHLKEAEEALKLAENYPIDKLVSL
jgi:hypothetical protein